MGNKENSSGNATQSGASKNNRRRPFYRKKNNSSSSGKGNNGNAKPKAAVREYKFYMHGSAQRKTSESYGKIKEAIILKIQNTFENPIAVANSISPGVKKVYTKPNLGKSTNSDADTKAVENAKFLEEWKIDFLITASNSMSNGSMPMLSS